MKKRILIFMAALLLPILLLTMVGCHSTKKIDKFGKKVVEGKNYEVEMTMSIPFVGTVTMITKVDGNKCYVSGTMGDPAQFYEVRGSQKIVYTQTEDGWERSEISLDEDKTSFYDTAAMEKLFCGDDYEYSREKKGYVLKNDATAAALQLSSVVMTFKKDTCIVTGSMSGIPVTFTFSNVGKTKVEMPE